MCSKVFKYVQMCLNLFKCVQTCSKLVRMCSNGFKWVQTCSKVVQICSNLFKIWLKNVLLLKDIPIYTIPWKITQEKHTHVANTKRKMHTVHVIKWRCTKGITQYSCKTDVPGWRDIHMNTSIHSPVSPLIVSIASYNQFHLAITYQGLNYHPFQCKGSAKFSSVEWKSSDCNRHFNLILMNWVFGPHGFHFWPSWIAIWSKWVAILSQWIILQFAYQKLVVFWF